MFDFNPVPLTLPQSATSKLTFNMVMSMSVASLTLQQWAVALDLQTILPAKDQNATRISALEDHLQREHNDLLVALQQAAAATGASWLRFIVLIVLEGEASTVDFKSFSGSSLLRSKKVTEHSKEIGPNVQKRISGIMECCDDCEGGGFKFKHFENFHLKSGGKWSNSTWQILFGWVVQPLGINQKKEKLSACPPNKLCWTAACWIYCRDESRLSIYINRCNYVYIYIHIQIQIYLLDASWMFFGTNTERAQQHSHKPSYFRKVSQFSI